MIGVEKTCSEALCLELKSNEKNPDNSREEKRSRNEVNEEKSTCGNNFRYLFGRTIDLRLFLSRSKVGIGNEIMTVRRSGLTSFSRRRRVGPVCVRGRIGANLSCQICELPHVINAAFVHQAL